MKRKILSVALVAMLIFALVSCDGGFTDVMKMMGKNMLGNDESQVSAAVESVKVSEENQITSTDLIKKSYGSGDSTITITDGKTLKYTDSDGEETELFTVGKTSDSNSKQVIAIGDVALVLDSSVTADVASITSVLPPQDLTDVINTLDSAGKDALLRELSKEVTDEKTKKAAEGTATLVQALMEITYSAMDDDVDDDVKEVVNDIKKNLADNKDKLTMGDVVVLQAFTNILATSGSVVLDTVDKAPNDEDVNISAVVEEVYDEAYDTILVIDKVSETSTSFKNVDLASIISKFM